MVPCWELDAPHPTHHSMMAWVCPNHDTPHAHHLAARARAPGTIDTVCSTPAVGKVRLLGVSRDVSVHMAAQRARARGWASGGRQHRCPRPQASPTPCRHLCQVAWRGSDLALHVLPCSGRRVALCCVHMLCDGLSASYLLCTIAGRCAVSHANP